MTTVTIPITAYSAQSASPDQRYGQLATLPLFNAAENVYFRAAVGSKIPDGATVVSATIQFRGRSNETGSYTARVQPLGTPPTWNSNVTWTNKPTTLVGTAVADTISSPSSGDLWEFTVTTDVQSVVSGTRVDYGWRMVADAGNATSMTFAGSTAETGEPVMVVEYTVVPDEPENLHPSGGSVSVAKPTLTFDGDDDMTALNVQIDPAADDVSPEFDSGSVAASGGLYDIAVATANLLPDSQGNAGTFDTDITGWLTSNCSIARVTTPTQAGAGALRLTATAAANMFAASSSSVQSMVPVVVGQSYHVEAYSRAATTGRSTRVEIQWYDSGGASLSTDTGTSSANDSSSWGLRELTATAPASAAYARPRVFVTSPAAGEQHYFDSVVFTKGPSWGGLAAGSSTFWRVRQQTAGGWSEWSDWVEFSRTAFPTLTLVSPASGTVEDPTFPVEWSFAGTQVAWQSWLRVGANTASGSGYTPGTDTTWTPTKGFTRDAQTGTLYLRVWDDEERVATAGDPEYTQITLDLTYELDASVDPMTTLVAAPSPDGLGVLLTGTRSTGTPDEAVLFRDGDNIATYTGTDVFTGTVLDGITDPLPPLGKPVVYRVAPRVGGLTASGGPTATITPSATGIWLYDTEDTDDRVLLHTETGVPEQDDPEDAIVHRPLNKGDDGLGQVVRRRLIRFRKEGVVNGVLMDDADGEALLRSWAEDYDAGHLFALAFSGYSGTVIVGNFVFTERDNPRQARSREVGVKFNYWAQE